MTESKSVFKAPEESPRLTESWEQMQKLAASNGTVIMGSEAH